MDSLLSPSPLGRAIFSETAFENAVRIGAKQYLIFAAGYDTFAYCQLEWAKKLQIFELDHSVITQDKQNRLKRSDIEIPDNVHYIDVDLTKHR